MTVIRARSRPGATDCTKTGPEPESRTGNSDSGWPGPCPGSGHVSLEPSESNSVNVCVDSESWCGQQAGPGQHGSGLQRKAKPAVMAPRWPWPCHGPALPAWEPAPKLEDPGPKPMRLVDTDVKSHTDRGTDLKAAPISDSQSLTYRTLPVAIRECMDSVAWRGDVSIFFQNPHLDAPDSDRPGGAAAGPSDSDYIVTRLTRYQLVVRP